MAGKQFKSFTHYGKIRNGKLIPNNARYFKGMVSLFADTNVKIIVEKIKDIRSNRQNRYYWGVVLYLIGQHTGYLPEDLHEIFKSKFLKTKRLWRGGEITTLRSTAELETDEFTEYIEQVREEGADMGIEIPDPDKNWYVKEEFADAYPDYRPIKKRKL